MNEEPLVRVIDDDEGVLLATKRLLSSVGIASQSSNSSTAFLAALDARMPGCVLLDIEMADCDGLTLQEILHDMAITLPIVFVTGRGDVARCIRAMKCGALDFLTKPVQAADLLDAVRRGIAVDRDQRALAESSRETRAKLAQLSPRERQVMLCLLTGRLNKQIGWDLDIGEMTVKVHRARLMHKLGVQSLAELVYLAERADLRVPRPPVVTNRQ